MPCAGLGEDCRGVGGHCGQGGGFPEEVMLNQDLQGEDGLARLGRMKGGRSACTEGLWLELRQRVVCRLRPERLDLGLAGPYELFFIPKAKGSFAGVWSRGEASEETQSRLIPKAQVEKG